MPPLLVIPLDVFTEPLLELRAVLGRVQIEVFILHGAPEPFDEDIVERPTTAIHADGNAVVLEDGHPCVCSELGTLVGVEDVWVSILGKRLLQCTHAEVRVHGVGHPPGQDLARVPVLDCDEVLESFCHGNVGNVRTPHLVGPLHSEVTKQVWVDLMGGMLPAGMGTGSQGNVAHDPHHPLDPFAIDSIPHSPEGRCDLPASHEGKLQVHLIHNTKEVHGWRCWLNGMVIQRGSAEAQQLTLTLHRKVVMATVYHRFPFLMRSMRPGLLAKKSRSTSS